MDPHPFTPVGELLCAQCGFGPMDPIHNPNTYARQHGNLGGWPTSCPNGCLFIAHDCEIWQDTIARMVANFPPGAALRSAPELIHMLMTPCTSCSFSAGMQGFALTCDPSLSPNGLAAA